MNMKIEQTSTLQFNSVSTIFFDSCYSIKSSTQRRIQVTFLYTLPERESVFVCVLFLLVLSSLRRQTAIEPSPSLRF